MYTCSFLLCKGLSNHTGVLSVSFNAQDNNIHEGYQDRTTVRSTRVSVLCCYCSLFTFSLCWEFCSISLFNFIVSCLCVCAGVQPRVVCDSWLKRSAARVRAIKGRFLSVLCMLALVCLFIFFCFFCIVLFVFLLFCVCFRVVSCVPCLFSLFLFIWLCCVVLCSNMLWRKND